MKLLITCFEPFGAITTNSSLEIAATIKDQIGDLEITKLLIPVSYELGFAKLAAYLSANQPDAIILCGQAAGRSTVSLERFAHNLCKANNPDNDGIIKNQEFIINNGPTLTSTFNLCKMLDYVNNESQYSVISEDAGGYVCNYLYYKTLYNYPNIPCVFIHFPLSNRQLEQKYPCLPLEVMKRELMKVIEFIVDSF